jgi:hypothetical protein
MRCPLLQELYLSSNEVDDAALAEIPESFPALEALCLFRNRVERLGSAVASLKRLPRLKKLDMDGNPCARAAEYPHALVRALPTLEALDGDPLRALDRDLARAFFEDTDGADADGADTDGADADGADAHCADTKAGAAPAAASDASARENAPEDASSSGVRLFRSDFLNNNPVMLDYLARSVIADPGRGAKDHRLALGVDAAAAGGASESSARRRGFVGRMRRGTAAEARGEAAARRRREERAAEAAEATARAIAATRNAAEAAAEARRGAGGSRDEIVRRLLMAIEVLQEERTALLEREREREAEAARAAEAGWGVEDVDEEDEAPKSQTRVESLARENARLQAENANLFSVLEQNKSLRLRLEAAELKVKSLRERLAPDAAGGAPPAPGGAPPAADAALASAGSASVGPASLEEARARIDALEERLAASEAARLEAEIAGRTGAVENRNSDGGERPRTAAQMLRGLEEDVDRELAEVLARSESSLASLRSDVRRAKAEMADGRPVGTHADGRPTRGDPDCAASDGSSDGEREAQTLPGFGTSEGNPYLASVRRRERARSRRGGLP